MSSTSDHGRIGTVTHTPRDKHAVVLATAVDVMQGEAERAAAPSRDPAQLARIRLDAHPQQSRLQVAAVAFSAHEHAERHSDRARHDLSALAGGVPRLRGEPEARLALRHAVTLVVEGLDLSPVVPAVAALVDSQPRVRACGRRSCSSRARGGWRSRTGSVRPRATPPPRSASRRWYGRRQRHRPRTHVRIRSGRKTAKASETCPSPDRGNSHLP
jgi:hypothetical protein